MIARSKVRFYRAKSTRRKTQYYPKMARVE